MPGGPFSYTVGAGHSIAVALADPGTYDLSLYGPNGFFRHFAGSPATTVRVEERGDHEPRRAQAPDHGTAAHRRPVVVDFADAYGAHRRITVHGTTEITIDTHHSGGWYDIALSTRSDTTFSYQLAGRLESGGRLTSDPQLGR